MARASAYVSPEANIAVFLFPDISRTFLAIIAEVSYLLAPDNLSTDESNLFKLFSTVESTDLSPPTTITFEAPSLLISLSTPLSSLFESVRRIGQFNCLESTLAARASAKSPALASMTFFELGKFALDTSIEV